jgi:CDP-diacylglycerol--serine O-phosphatidyltransferase
MRYRDGAPHTGRPRLKGLSFNRLIPNIVTVLALCAGLTAIRFGLQERWEMAVLAILLAGVFDGLDGRLARRLGGSSKFGAALDSLSDFVSFGVAPAVLLYLWAMHVMGGLGWSLVLLFSVCAALRLARFNTIDGSGDRPVWAYNYFSGLATPAAACAVLLPMILSFEAGSGFFDSPAVIAVVVIAVSFLMVSSIPTYSFKSFRIPHRYVLPTLLLAGLFTAALTSEPWPTVAAGFAAYLASIPFSIRSYRHLRREAERLQAPDKASDKASDKAPDKAPDQEEGVPTREIAPVVEIHKARQGREKP